MAKITKAIIPETCVEKINELLSGPRPAKKVPDFEVCKNTIITAYQNKWTPKEIADSMIQEGAKNVDSTKITKALKDWGIIVKTPEQIAAAAISTKKAQDKAKEKAKAKQNSSNEAN